MIVFGFFLPAYSCVDADSIPSKVNEIPLPPGTTRVRFEKNLFQILYKTSR
ncbi:hypothetical protein LEP1GSC170_2627 [Leptospira interrogans serovar Bataviae str. HAI135]|nr:hypothetical protein LEP1GSC170_2627 [Leptospira interrogans serovar Bataviae str. HAI135]